MSNNSYPEPWSDVKSVGATREEAFAISNFINRVYGWMCGGLALSGALAWYVADNQAAREAILGRQGVFMTVIVLELVLVMALSFAINKINSTVAGLGFALYSALTGLTLAPIFLVYTQSSIATTFFITSGAFGATSLYGYVTKRDLSAMGRILFMALIGIVIASIVNIFVRSSALEWVTSYIGVVVFAGLAAYDTQKIRRMAIASARGEIDAENAKKGAIMGALALYLDFINLFLMLLKIFGRRR